MNRSWILAILIGVALCSATAVIYLANFLIIKYKIADAGIATIIGGVLTLLGIIFTAGYNEISSYYKDRNQNIAKKWDLIYPYIKNHYNPWIASALAFHYSLQKIISATNSQQKISSDQVTLTLYEMTSFFGNRLKFTIQEGGLILLSSTKEQKKVNEAYIEIEKKLRWGGAKTALFNSYLANLYYQQQISQPYTLQMFAKNIESDKKSFSVEEISLYKIKLQFENWITNYSEEVIQVNESISHFADTFQISIDKLYSSWDI